MLHRLQAQVGRDDADLAAVQQLPQRVARRVRVGVEEVDPDAGISDDHGAAQCFS